jgi:hypothetical protein
MDLFETAVRHVLRAPTQELQGRPVGWGRGGGTNTLLSLYSLTTGDYNYAE